jgi:hypothetical protein
LPICRLLSGKECLKPFRVYVMSLGLRVLGSSVVS